MKVGIRLDALGHILFLSFSVFRGDRDAVLELYLIICAPPHGLHLDCKGLLCKRFLRKLLAHIFKFPLDQRPDGLFKFD